MLPSRRSTRQRLHVDRYQCPDNSPDSPRRNFEDNDDLDNYVVPLDAMLEERRGEAKAKCEELNCAIHLVLDSLEDPRLRTFDSVCVWTDKMMQAAHAARDAADRMQPILFDVVQHVLQLASTKQELERAGLWCTRTDRGLEDAVKLITGEVVSAAGVAKKKRGRKSLLIAAGGDEGGRKGELEVGIAEQSVRRQWQAMKKQKVAQEMQRAMPVRGGFVERMQEKDEERYFRCPTMTLEAVGHPEATEQLDKWRRLVKVLCEVSVIYFGMSIVAQLMTLGVLLQSALEAPRPAPAPGGCCDGDGGYARDCGDCRRDAALRAQGAQVLRGARVRKGATRQS